ncbi:hypothetical protein CDAR_547341 [Caerostris darwini]|uniref:Uncharacterized protein n=1 Tax=Caerostris darwini TaxID=1538125 RepID=A0AAV4V871_9ARAC|nr:hypothetical protein CDAR_547341 [Caerostris darwini]
MCINQQSPEKAEVKGISGESSGFRAKGQPSLVGPLLSEFLLDFCTSAYFKSRGPSFGKKGLQMEAVKPRLLTRIMGWGGEAKERMRNLLKASLTFQLLLNSA